MEVKLKKFDPPRYIEELTFWVKPDLIERYIQLDAELWVPALCTRQGFLGSEVWLGEEGSGEITMLYFWEKKENFTGLDEVWQNDLKDKTHDVMGENMKFIGTMKSTNKWKVREYYP